MSSKGTSQDSPSTPSNTTIDPDHVKSPRPASISKHGKKSSFLSGLLCCFPVGAGKLVDDVPTRKDARPRKEMREKPARSTEAEVPNTGDKEEQMAIDESIDGQEMVDLTREDAELLQGPLLPAPKQEHLTRKCLVLDLDETLVHSSFKIIPQADFVVPVEIDNQVHNVYVLKRPGVDEFMRRVGEMYEVVVFTASLSKYADPVLDILDVHRVVTHRLFRESCYNHKGNYVKDLSMLGRELGSSIIIDNSPASYLFHPSNAVPISSWFNDPHDTELLDLVPFLDDLRDVDDVAMVLDCSLEPPNEEAQVPI